MELDDSFLKAKLSFNWTGLYNILAAGPASPKDTPNGRPLHTKLIYLDLPTEFPGADCNRRVSVAHCKPCRSPHIIDEIAKCLPDGLRKCVLNGYATNPPSLPRHN